MVDTGLIFSLQLDDPQSKFWALLVLFELCMFIKFKFPKDNVLWIPPVGLLIIAITIDCINMSNFIDTYEACLYFACSYTAQLILSSDSHHLTDSMLILFTCPRERLLWLVIMGYSCSKRIAAVIVTAVKLENCLVSFVWVAERTVDAFGFCCLSVFINFFVMLYACVCVLTLLAAAHFIDIPRCQQGFVLLNRPNLKLLRQDLY